MRRAPVVRSKGGRREDLGLYFRSRMEANTARWLNFIQHKGHIVKWEYEPDEFWFDKIKRGTRSYKPDFKIYKPDGSVYYLECKGYMDAVSRTKLARMARYYPDVKIELMDKKRYALLRRQIGVLLEWE